MKFFSASFLKEATLSFIVFLPVLLAGCSRGYIMFLFSQFELLNSRINISMENFSWIASLPYLLKPVGCLIFGTLMDTYGRKICLNSVLLLFFVSWLTVGFSQNIFMFYFAFIVAGIALGGLMCASVYISEICSPKHRTFLLSTMDISFSIGFLLANVLMYNFEWYRAAFIFSAFSAISLFVSFFVPESPMWLRLNGDPQKSVQVLSSIRCEDASNLDEEIKEIEKLCKLYEEKKTTSRNYLKTILVHWKPCAILVLLFSLSQNAGLTIFETYTIMIVDQLNITFDSSKVAMLFSIGCLASSFTAPFLIDKLGRKCSLAVSGLCMGICMIIVAVYEEISFYELVRIYWWIPTIAITAYSFFMSLGPACTLFTIGGELFPQEVVGVMNGLYGAFEAIYTYSVVKIFPEILLPHFGMKACLWIFACFGILLGVCTILWLPETSGKSLCTIQDQYFSDKSAKLKLPNRVESTKL